MAELMARGTGFTVRWRGPDGSYRGNAEFFESRAAAQHFKVDVETHGGWPPEWVKGQGYLTEEEKAALEAANHKGTSLRRLAQRRFEQLREAQDISPDTLNRYRRYVRLFAGALPVALRLDELLEDDDTLRAQVIEQPTVAADLVHQLIGGMSEEELAKGAEVYLEDVDRAAIAAWVRYMRVMGKSTKTIRNYHGCLHGVFEEAVDAGLIERNPFHKTKLGRNVPVRKKVILEPAEFLIVHGCMHAHYQDFIEVGVGTGLRFGELSALRVCDWVSSERMLHVTEAWKRGLPGQGYYRGTTKTQAGERWVRVGPSLAAVIDRHCEGKDPQSTDLIFTAVRGGRIRQNVFGDAFQVAVAKAQIDHGMTKHPVFHDLRHTHISWLRDANLPDMAIKDLVGHTEVDMTQRYGGVTTETFERAASAIETRLPRKLRVA